MRGASLSTDTKQENYKSYTLDYDTNELHIGNIKLYNLNNYN